MRNRYTEFERSIVIGKTSIDKQAAEAARRWNQTIDTEVVKRRKEWVFIPPSNMTISLHDGLVLSVPHDIGRVILHKRKGRIIERDDVTIDAVIDGGIEDAIEAMDLCKKPLQL